MKRNLTWLCLAMFLVIALDFGFGIAGGTSAFMAGWNSVDDEKTGEIDAYQITCDETNNWPTILLPKDRFFFFRKFHI